MAAISSNQQISNESFSHGWLSSMKQQSWDFLEESLSRSFDGASFIEVDPDFFSMRWTDSKDLNFSHPVLDGASLTAKSEAGSSSTTPSSDSAAQSESWRNSVSADSSSPSLRSPDSMSPKQSTKSPGKILRKYLNFLVPLYWKVKRLKMTPLKQRSSAESSRSSLRKNDASPSLERRRGSRVFDAEPASSIHDAVLHCKKSIATA